VAISPYRPTYPLLKVPIIAVFTKYDKLIDQVEYELEPVDELGDDAINELIKARAETRLQEICIGPLERSAGSDIPHVAVSGGYRCSGCLVCAS
jgi:hypothetical protein